MRTNFSARLILVRHGASAYVHRGGLFATPDVHAWRAGYDAAGITDTSLPPDALLRRVDEATHLVASDLPRAIASAERLARGRAIQTSPLLREIPLAIPDLPVRLPLAAWGAAIHVAWSYRILRKREHPADDTARVSAAAAWLKELTGSDLAVVVTHGVFRAALAKELLRAGWTAEGRRGGYSHWSAWSFALPTR